MQGKTLNQPPPTTPRQTTPPPVPPRPTMETMPEVGTVEYDIWAAKFFRVNQTNLRRRRGGVSGPPGGQTDPMLVSNRPPPPTRRPPPIPPKPVLQNVQGINAQAQQQAVLGPVILAGLPDNDHGNHIRELMGIHAKLVPDEVKVFKGYEYIENISLIRNPDEREKKLKEISEVLQAVHDRREDLRASLKEFPQPQPEEVTKAISAGWQCFQGMNSHLPDDYQRMDGAKARARVDTLMMSDDDRKQALADAKDGFKDDNGVDISASLGDTFRGVVEPVSTKSFERQNFYFDQFVASPPQDQIKQLMEVTDKILAQGQKIMDCGGKLKDVEALMAKTGIPKDWWPPQLVDTLQAWRKVERAMQEERVADAFKKKEEKGTDITTIQGFTDFFCDTAPEIGLSINKIMGEPKVTEPIKTFLESLQNGYGLGKLAITCLQTGNFDELPGTDAQKLLDGIDKSMEVIGSAVDTTCSALNIATSAGATILSSVVPGLSLASAGIKLALAIKKLAQHTATRVQTGLMKNDAVKALGNSMMEDGGAFLNSLDNEVNGRNKQITQDGVEVFSAGSDLAGSAAGTFGGHYGMAAQGALKIVSTGVTLGSKFIFTNVNWAEAKKAKALLEEAQAGNPVARMEIFKDSNLYAKMYVCVLCKEGNPLAKKFVYQRGIEEEDLDGAMSMKILREALLKSSDQEDENDIEDNWLLANTGAVGKGVQWVGKKVAGLPNAINELRKDRTTAYDPKWAPTGTVEITEADWKKTKAAAIKAGLYDEETGIGSALSTAEKKIEKAQKLLPQLMKGGLSPSTKEGKAAQTTLLEALDALDAVYSAAYKYRPISNPAGKPPKSEVHKGMTLYLGLLVEVVSAARKEFDTSLQDSGLKKVDWQPNTGSNLLDPVAFDTNWKSAVTNACLPDDDAGLGNKLEKLAEAKLAYESAQGTKKRDKALEYSEALNVVVSVGKSCQGNVGSVAGMAAYVQKIVSKAGADRVALDKILGASDWKPTIPAVGSITSSAWQTLWAEAVKGGHVSSKAGDGGVEDALKTMENLILAVGKATEAKAKLKARMDYAKAAGEILLAKGDFLKAQRDVGQPLKQFVENAYTQAFNQQNSFDDDRAAVDFAVTPGLTAAAWQATYDDAVSKGALPAAKGAAKAMKSALEDYAKAKADLEKKMLAKAYKDAREYAVKTEKYLNEAIDAIDSKLMGADGYAKNAKMSAYLKTQREALKKALEYPQLVAALSGDAAGAEFKAATFTWKLDAFTAIKADAIRLGVIADQKTGMNAAMKATASSYSEFSTLSKATPPAPEAIKKAKEKALKEVSTLLTTAAKLKKLSKNANWLAYANSAVTEIGKLKEKLL